jgi:hypothetical protein
MESSPTFSLKTTSNQFESWLFMRENWPVESIPGSQVLTRFVAQYSANCLTMNHSGIYAAGSMSWAQVNKRQKLGFIKYLDASRAGED